MALGDCKYILDRDRSARRPVQEISKFSSRLVVAAGAAVASHP